MKMKIGIIGCGNMGQALLSGILAEGYTHKSNILCSDRDKKKAAFVRSRFKASICSTNSQLFDRCDPIIIAVKPSDVQAVLAEAHLPLRDKLVISVCAGIGTRLFERILGKVAVVRVMPNMPARIGEGISAVALGRFAKERDKKVTFSIFSCVGEVVEIKERLMDAVTAISGSGPAYFFYLVEKLIDAAEELGISRNIAQRLAIKTALGSASLLNKSEEDAQVLRRKVTSKGGTTQAAFAVFQRRGLEGILNAAFKAAAKRSKELEAK
ncbi:MAG: pyrroline-5-carboxylate reductase [Candidatus Omnitrophica bacterium]|nr:pyrroline-5-carboxylate reductase [Candidatus Omnitrophota bacterium]